MDPASVLMPEIMAPVLASADIREHPLPYLPSGESLSQTTEEIQDTLTSPQFLQALGMLSMALALGQPASLLFQFGQPVEAVQAANKGGVESFAKVMQSSARSEQEGSGKDRKDKEEDVSLTEIKLFAVFYEVMFSAVRMSDVCGLLHALTAPPRLANK